MMNNEKEKDAIDASKLDEILPKYDPLKLNGINLAQNYVSAFNTGMNIYQCVNQLQGYIEWVVKAVNDVVKLWNVQVGESIDQSKAIVRETTTEQFNVEWTNKQPELIEQVNTLTTNQFNEDWGVLENRINTTLETQNTNIQNIQNDQNELETSTNNNINAQNTKINSIQTQQTNLASEQTNLANQQITLSNRMDTFTSLSQGSTTGDAELKDIRVGANGKTYDTAGNAVRGQYSQLKEDIDWLNSTCQYYQESEINPSDYDSNSKIIKFREILPVGSNIRIKIIAESYGYIAAIARDGATETSIKIDSTIVNIGDVLSVNGVSDIDISEVYIYSPNNVKCKVLILSTNKPKNEIIVDANGYGDYRSLDDAIANANDSKEMPVVIRVRPGTYYTRTETPSDIPYVKKNRYISIIGDSKNNCIIRNDNGYYSPYTDDSHGMLYDSTPIRLSGMVTIENLTIISTMSNFENWVSDHSTEVKGNDGANSYCIHIDFDAPENSVALVKNCILVNDHYSCIGAGNRKNYTIKIEDCELTSKIDERVSSPDNGSTIFVHSYNLNSGNAYDGQNIFIKNNIIKNTNKHNACYFYASAPDRMYCTLIGNVCKTSDNSQAFVSIGNAYGITKTDLCFGNNIETMNN